MHALMPDTSAPSKLADWSLKVRFDGGYFCTVKVGRLEFKGTPSLCLLQRWKCLFTGPLLYLHRQGWHVGVQRYSLAAAVARVEVSLHRTYVVVFCAQP